MCIKLHAPWYHSGTEKLYSNIGKTGRMRVFSGDSFFQIHIYFVIRIYITVFLNVTYHCLLKLFFRIFILDDFLKIILQEEIQWRKKKEGIFIFQSYLRYLQANESEAKKAGARAEDIVKLAKYMLDSEIKADERIQNASFFSFIWAFCTRYFIYISLSSPILPMHSFIHFCMIALSVFSGRMIFNATHFFESDKEGAYAELKNCYKGTSGTALVYGIESKVRRVMSLSKDLFKKGIFPLFQFWMNLIQSRCVKR